MLYVKIDTQSNQLAYLDIVIIIIINTKIMDYLNKRASFFASF